MMAMMCGHCSFTVRVYYGFLSECIVTNKGFSSAQGLLPHPRRTISEGVTAVDQNVVSRYLSLIVCYTWRRPIYDGLSPQCGFLTVYDRPVKCNWYHRARLSFYASSTHNLAVLDEEGWGHQ